MSLSNILIPQINVDEWKKLIVKQINADNINVNNVLSIPRCQLKCDPGFVTVSAVAAYPTFTTFSTFGIHFTGSSTYFIVNPAQDGIIIQKAGVFRIFAYFSATCDKVVNTYLSYVINGSTASQTLVLVNQENVPPEQILDSMYGIETLAVGDVIRIGLAPQQAPALPVGYSAGFWQLDIEVIG